MDYESLRQEYRPAIIKYLLIAEAPPEPKEDARFFYLPRHMAHDGLFTYTMKALYPETADLSEDEIKSDKAAWLTKFRDDGFYLIDAVEHPIIQSSSSSIRRKIIKESFISLINRVESLINTDTKIILIKATVYDVLAYPMKAKGLPVINDTSIPFPAFKWQPKYVSSMQSLLRRNGWRNHGV